MHRRHFVSFLAVTAAAVPVALIADDHDHDKRYYDKEHKDYHHWDEPRRPSLSPVPGGETRTISGMGEAKG